MKASAIVVNMLVSAVVSVACAYFVTARVVRDAPGPVVSVSQPDAKPGAEAGDHDFTARALIKDTMKRVDALEDRLAR